MSRPLATGSGLERAVICEASSVLPRVETVTDDAERGKAIHAFLESAGKDRDSALAAVPEALRPICEALDVSKLPTDPSAYAAEVAFAFDTVTGKARELGRGIGRAYDCKETEIAGTADVIALLDDDGVFVADYKTGWSRRPKAADSLQLRFYALSAARAYGRSRAVVQMIRVMEDGETYTDEASLDAFDLDSFAAELGALASSIEAAREWFAEDGHLEATEGDHCRFCPSFASCPAKLALVSSMAGAEIGPLTPEVAARAYDRLRLYKQAIERADEILKDYARTTPIPLPGGQVYGVRYDDTKRIDGKVAAKVLREWFGEAAEAGIEVDVSQASIKRALAAAGSRGIKLPDVLAEIQKRGGLKVTRAPKLVAHQPKEAA